MEEIKGNSDVKLTITCEEVEKILGKPPYCIGKKEVGLKKAIDNLIFEILKFESSGIETNKEIDYVFLIAKEKGSEQTGSLHVVIPREHPEESPEKYLEKAVRLRLSIADSLEQYDKKLRKILETS